MQFEWDEAKHRQNLAQRGIGFDDGAMIFASEVVEHVDDRRDYGELRIRAIGMSGDGLLHLVYTRRGDVRRIISVRRANRKECEIWLQRE